VPGFSGSVEHGASCNCQTLTLIPHCNGTHTECVGHLTREPLDAHRVAPFGLLPAFLVTVGPVEASSSDESTDPTPHPNDQLITRHALEKSWHDATAAGDSMTAAQGAGSRGTAGAGAPGTTGADAGGATRTGATALAAASTISPAHFEPRALIIRTLPNQPDKQYRNYSDSTPPYLSREAAELLIERGIEHLVVDLPSIDRAHDEGRLTAHRIFFGLPPGSTTLAKATRPRATVTELAYIPDTARDGPYLLELQVPALGGDAVPSRPLLYSLSDRNSASAS
jgi:hypothetical protein